MLNCAVLQKKTEGRVTTVSRVSGSGIFRSSLKPEIFLMLLHTIGLIVTVLVRVISRK